MTQWFFVFFLFLLRMLCSPGWPQTVAILLFRLLWHSTETKDFSGLSVWWRSHDGRNRGLVTASAVRKKNEYLGFTDFLFFTQYRISGHGDVLTIFRLDLATSVYHCSYPDTNLIQTIPHRCVQKLASQMTIHPFKLVINSQGCFGFLILLPTNAQIIGTCQPCSMQYSLKNSVNPQFGSCHKARQVKRSILLVDGT